MFLSQCPNRVLKKSLTTRFLCKNPNDFEGQFFKTCLFQQPANIDNEKDAVGFGGKRDLGLGTDPSEAGQ